MVRHNHITRNVFREYEYPCLATVDINRYAADGI